MIKIDSFLVTDTFFAARNSHGGFQSLFDEVFNPRDYTKLFILKGGPGTGKSTFMRGLVSFANGHGIDAEAVLCSSDPSSLDGVIMEKVGRRIAVIDGTAPHCKDPIFPGAVDEIINLGESFNSKMLEEKRTEILQLSEAKARGYKSAYSTLRSAKDIFDYIWYSLCNSAFYNEAELLSKSIHFDAENRHSDIKSTAKLYSAFGKDGYKILPPKVEEKTVRIGGNRFIVSLLLDAIYRDFRGKNWPVVRVSSALDERVCERLIIGKATAIWSEGGECDIDLGEYKIEDYCPCFDSVYSAYTSLLELAKTHFKAASDAHFGLEAIYSSAVNFENNERLFGDLCNRLGDIFA